MSAQRTTRSSPRYFFSLCALLILVTGATGVVAQVSAPFPNHAQVISQGVEWIADGDVRWHAEVVSVHSQSESNPMTLEGGFLFTQDGGLLATRSNGEAELLTPGQATFAPMGAWKHVVTTEGSPVDASLIRLMTGPVPDRGGTTSSFRLPEGYYNLQLTRGVLGNGDIDRFIPQNNGVYFAWVPTGVVEINTPGRQDFQTLDTGDTLEATGSLEFRSVGDGPATYVIASVGQKVDLPTSAGTGEVLMTFHDCSAEELATLDPARCQLISYPVPIMLTR